MSRPDEMCGRLRRTPGSEQATSSTESSRASIPRTGSRCRPWDPGFGRYGSTRTGEHRVVYVARFDEAIYVLHAFEKKTRKTGRADIDVAGKRLRDVLRDRRRSGPAG